MADIAFNNWAEFSGQFGDLVGETRLDAAKSAFKNAHKIVYGDDGIIAVYVNASCKKEALKNSTTLSERGWIVTSAAAPKNGVVFALVIGAISTDEDTTMTTTNTTPNTAAAPVAMSIDDQIRSLLAACNAANDNANTANAAVAKLAATVDGLATTVAAASTAASSAAAAAAEAKKESAAATAESAAAKKESAAAVEAANNANAATAKTAAELAGIKTEIASLKLTADDAAKKNKKKDKKEKEAGEGWSTEEKVVAAVAGAAVGFLLYKAVVKD